MSAAISRALEVIFVALLIGVGVVFLIELGLFAVALVQHVRHVPPDRSFMTPLSMGWLG